MVWWLGTKHVNRILTSFFSSKNVLAGFFFFNFDRNQNTIPLFTDARNVTFTILLLWTYSKFDVWHQT